MKKFIIKGAINAEVMFIIMATIMISGLSFMFWYSDRNLSSEACFRLDDLAQKTSEDIRYVPMTIDRENVCAKLTGKIGQQSYIKSITNIGYKTEKKILLEKGRKARVEWVVNEKDEMGEYPGSKK